MTTHYGNSALRVLEDNCEHYKDMVDDEQISVNHVTCSMGEDTKHRLYVKRSDGSYLWHCHNCGESGFYRNSKLEHIELRRSKHVSAYTKDVDFKPYLAATRVFDNFTLEQQLWLLQYQFDEFATTRCRIRASDKGIFLPITSNDDIVGYQVRQFNKQPKYLTFANTHYSHKHVDNDVLVITEDLMSSYKLNLAGCSSLSLLGTTLHKEVVDFILKMKYNKVAVWLDDDIAGHRGMREIINYLRPVIKNISTVDLPQPKDLPFATLNCLTFER